MTKRHLLFLVIVLGLSLIEAAFLLFMDKYTTVAKDPKFLLVMSVVLFLLIPLNIFAAWKLTVRAPLPKE